MDMRWVCSISTNRFILYAARVTRLCLGLEVDLRSGTQRICDPRDATSQRGTCGGQFPGTDILQGATTSRVKHYLGKCKLDMDKKTCCLAPFL